VFLNSWVATHFAREHWTGEVLADEWVPIFPVLNRPLVLWKKYFVFIKTTYSSRYSFVACNSGMVSIPWLRQQPSVVYHFQSMSINFLIKSILFDWLRHLWIMTTSEQRPFIPDPIGGGYTQVWLYLNYSYFIHVKTNQLLGPSFPMKGVDFINFLRTHFSSEHLFGSFSLVTCK